MDYVLRGAWHRRMMVLLVFVGVFFCFLLHTLAELSTGYVGGLLCHVPTYAYHG